METYPKPSKLECEDNYSSSEIESKIEFDNLLLTCAEDLEDEFEGSEDLESDYSISIDNNFEELFHYYYNSFGEIVIIYKKDKEVHKVLKISEEPFSIRPSIFVYTDKFKQLMGFDTECKPRIVGKNQYDTVTEICYEVNEDGQFIIHTNNVSGLVERIEYEGVNNCHDVNYIEDY